MPRQSRIDAPGALHHVIARGIGRRKIFNDDPDRDEFIERLGGILQETRTACYAWALIPNHFHLLLRTGKVPVATVMRRLLTGHASTYNRRHRRRGHLFQNRYKSILCQEEPYLLELVRYIHLNPLRAKLVKDLAELDGYGYAGHSTVMGKRVRTWQDTAAVLGRFGRRTREARREYRRFMTEGIGVGRRPDLIGGGLIRSMGGWSAVKKMRKAKAFMKGDERILGDSDFVERVLAEAEESFERGQRLVVRGVDLNTVAQRTAQLFDLEVERVWSAGKHRPIVKVRSLLCYWAVRELGFSMASLAHRLNLSVTAVSQSVARGERLARDEGYSLADDLNI